MNSTGFLLGPLALGLTLALVSGATGCAARYIPNTDVEDNDENRDIIKFCERYRHALEDQNVEVLLSMASPRYYEDGGNVDPTDDLDYAGLRDWLQSRFQDTHSIRYEIRYRTVSKGERDRLYVLYTYSASFKLPGLKQELEWRHTVADNRLEIIRDDKGVLRIIAGM